MKKYQPVKKGERFGRLIVIDPVKRLRPKKRHAFALVECSCGKKKVVRHSALRHEEIISCGCLRYSNPEAAIKRLDRAIQHEINIMNKYEADHADYSKVMHWLHEKAKQLDDYKVYGGGDGEFGAIRACLTE